MGRKHGEPWFSGTLVIGDPQENVEKSGDFLDFSNVFMGFLMLRWYQNRRKVDKQIIKNEAFFGTRFESDFSSIWGRFLGHFGSQNR